MSSFNNLKIFTGNSNKELAIKISRNLSIPLGKSEVSRFSDGEVSIKINESVRGSDVFVIQSTCSPANDNLMELLIMLDALKRASGDRIVAVIPWYGYSRQDKKLQSRDPIRAKLIADIITKAGASRVITIDLHAAQIQGFFDIPVDNLTAKYLFLDYFKKKNLKDVTVVAPDTGNVKMARDFASKLKVPLAIIDKRRPKENIAEVMNVIGDVKNKNIIIIDDIVDTAGSLCGAAKALKENEARDIYACCTHSVLSGEAIKRIKDSDIKELIVSDTIPLIEAKRISKIKQISCANLLAEAIKRTHEGKSLSVLFE